MSPRAQSLEPNVPIGYMRLTSESYYEPLLLIVKGKEEDTRKPPRGI